MSLDYSKWVDEKNTTNLQFKYTKGKITDVDLANKYANVMLLNDTTESSIRLKNKTCEVLAIGDYVLVEYMNTFSSSNAYIVMKYGNTRHMGYIKPLSQTEYDVLEVEGKIVDGIMYVIIGD